jgi:methyltransferase (TIGR00027 family)
MDLPRHTLTATAHWTAAARARETAREDRLFDDPYAAALAGEIGWRVLEASELASGGENPYLPVRTRWFDAVVLAQADRLDQIVLLGAGFDARAFRLSLPRSTRWFELDLPEVFADKEPALASLAAEPACDRLVVASSLTGRWSEDLVAAGFDIARPTLWLAEGLFVYFDAATVARLLDDATLLSQQGSVFAADIFGTGLLRLRDWGSRPPYCSDDPTGLFERAGWPDVRVELPGNEPASAERLRSATLPSEAADPAPANRAWFVVARR